MTIWIGDVPKVDDFGTPIVNEFIDGKTRGGPWGIMTPLSHAIYGLGIGTGRGQRYIKQANGQWRKAEG